uniref:F-box domain-containing protein n=1 Tax=Arundo donax TaxID=35708 RepID=A0A0A8YKN4_ARUDO
MGGAGRHRRLSSPAPVPPLEDDNLLAEILLRLPPRPSSLPRAAAVCKRWCRLVSDRHFLGRFRDHHRAPPLLGFFHGGTFVPTQEPPDHLPAATFSFNPDGPWKGSSRVCLIGYRGLLLAWNEVEFLVLDPMADLWRRIPAPAKHTMSWPWAAVVPPTCSSSDRSLFCFRLIALFSDKSSTRFARIYSSESGAWEHSVALSDSESSRLLITHRPGGSVVGNAVYWMFVFATLASRARLCLQSVAGLALPF